MRKAFGTVLQLHQHHAVQHGRRKGGLWPLWFQNLTFSHQIFSKKGSFLNFEWLKWNFATFSPRCKNHFGYLWKIYYWPLAGRKSLRRPSPMLSTMARSHQCFQFRGFERSNLPVAAHINWRSIYLDLTLMVITNLVIRKQRCRQLSSESRHRSNKTVKLNFR